MQDTCKLKEHALSIATSAKRDAHFAIYLWLVWPYQIDFRFHRLLLGKKYDTVSRQKKKENGQTSHEFN